jgi:hypothetical protein
MIEESTYGREVLISTERGLGFTDTTVKLELGAIPNLFEFVVV